MSFEERMDRLKERSEALIRSIEQGRRNIQDRKLRTSATSAAPEEDGENLWRLAGIADATLDSIKRFESIAGAHNGRIERLEDRQ
jgi:hypothetical protein